MITVLPSSQEDFSLCFKSLHSDQYDSHLLRKLYSNHIEEFQISYFEFWSYLISSQDEAESPDLRRLCTFYVNFGIVHTMLQN